VRFDPSSLIARTRAEALEEAASIAENVRPPFVPACIRALAAAERAKIPTRDNRITDCIEDYADNPSEGGAI
jgi:hypothetical protein